MKKIITGIWIMFLIAGCSRSDEKNVNEYVGTKALLWYQLSAEAEALYYQGYNIATEIIDAYEFQDDGLPPAVVLDIDETVLDNSAFNVNMLRDGFTYSEEKWAEWCERREAIPLPGAVEFTRMADSLGVEVFYVSNRAEALKEATIDNMREFGFPNSDTVHLLLKTSGSSKDQRREKIGENYGIILLLGDNLGDFDGIFDDRKENYGKTTVREFEKEFGTRFIIFPNPVYGNWDRAVFPQGMPGEKEVLEVLRGY